MFRENVVHEARGWLLTPFRHHGRLKGVGVDCAGLVLGVGKALGLMPQHLDFDYPEHADNGTLEQGVARWLEPSELLPGSILVLRAGRSPRHLAIVTDEGIVHALYGERVREHPLGNWRERIISVHGFRGVY